MATPLAAPTAPGIPGAAAVPTPQSTGPTYADWAKSETPVASAPTIGSVYGNVSSSDQGVADAAKYYQGVAATPVDQQSIRDGVMKRLQSEIDATNSVYAQKLA